MESKFVHLHLHTEYSLLDGFCRTDRLFEKAKKLGMTSVAITDHGVMYGVVDFYKKAKEYGIKPIIGCEVYVSENDLSSKNGNEDKKRGHLVLLAKNEVGYKNLIKLVSLGFTKGFYYKPRIDYKVLSKYSKGLIALSACLAGDVQKLLIDNRYEDAKNMALKINSIMGKGNFYLEIQDQGLNLQKKINPYILSLSKDTEIELVATNDVHYIDKHDSDAHDVLLCIQTGKHVDDEKRLKFPSDEFYFKSYEEMLSAMPYAKVAIENTVKIAEKCNFDFNFNEMHLPEYELEENQNAKELLRELCYKGLNKLYDVNDKHIKRLEFELKTIDSMGYNDYFLIVWDFIKFAKDNGIVVGPGRGSCNGSIVSYVLNITTVDPLEYDLIFERFLNPERVTMPDIDIDFEDDRRSEVIDYVIKKYGKDKVAQIITFGTFGAKAAIRDVGRVLNIPYSEVDKIAKEIPFQIGITIEKAIKQNKKLKDIYESNQMIKKLIDTARKIEGVPRHTSTHAAGIVISKKSIDEYVPLYLQDGNVSTQFNMILLEELGLLKMDFLGLRTLSVIKNTTKLLKKSRNIDIDIEKIPLDDQSVYKLIGKGDTLGIFQLESTGMRKFLRELKPSSLEDIIAATSLYRPGPMDSIPKYLKNKNALNQDYFITDKLKPILSVTYGCLVYQEQVMQIVRDLGGYTFGRSDLVRRAMSKKKMKVMEEERNNFVFGKKDANGNILIDGCIRRGIDEKKANEIFDDMIDFAKYAFNKSHAAGYSIIIYRTAFLKTHYPLEYRASLMSSFMGNQNKIALYIDDCRKNSIEILPPDINKSFKNFSVENGAIRYSFKAIKNVGNGMIESVLEERKNGEFSDFNNFCERVDPKELNKKAVESMIKSGTFDSFRLKRSQLISMYESIIESIHIKSRNNVKGQFSLFDSNMDIDMGDISKFKYPNIKEFPLMEKLNFEKEMIGVYLSSHPLETYRELIDKMDTFDLVNINEENIMNVEGKSIVIAGVISKITNKNTRKNEMMSFINIEDYNGVIEAIVFPRLFIRRRNIINIGEFIVARGRINVKDENDIKMILDDIEILNEENSKKYIRKELNRKRIFIKIDSYDEIVIKRIYSILKNYKGENKVVIYLANEKKKMIVDKKLWVSSEIGMIKELKKYLGEEMWF